MDSRSQGSTRVYGYCWGFMKSDAVGSATSEIKITGVSVRRTGDTTHRRQVLGAKVVLFRTASTEFKDMSGGPSPVVGEPTANCNARFGQQGR